MLLACCLLLFLSSPAAVVVSSLRYPLPSFGMKISVLENGLALTDFSIELERVTEMHISANLREELNPTGPLGIDSFNEIIVSSRMVGKELANATEYDISKEGRRIILDVDFFSGYAVFEPHDEALPENSDFVANAMFNLLTLAFGTREQYARLIARFQASDALAGIKGCVISVDNPDFDNDDGDGSLSPGVVVAIVILVLVILAVVGYFFFVRRIRKNKARTRPTSTKTTDRSGILEDSVDDSDGDMPHAAMPISDEKFLDEWSQKLTSIPLTAYSVKPKQRRPLPRPALQTRRNLCLHSIEEEGSESGSVASLSVDNRRGTSNNTFESALGPTFEEDDDIEVEYYDEDDDEYGGHHSMIVV